MAAIWTRRRRQKRVKKVRNILPFHTQYVLAKNIKSLIYKNKKPGIVLTDPVRNTKINSIKTVKTKTPLELRGNTIVFSKCVCKEKIRIVKTKFNQTAEQLSKEIITKKSKCDVFTHAYKKFKVRRGLFYSNQTAKLCTYLHWKYRHKLDTKHKYEFPTSRLMKLIKPVKKST